MFGKSSCRKTQSPSLSESTQLSYRPAVHQTCGLRYM